MPFTLTDDGCEIYYVSHGSGPAIAFASGFMGITDIWKHQIAEVSARYRCIAFDNRGARRRCGRTAASSGCKRVI